MKNTLNDFVKMLYERECGVVVMLCGCEEGGVEMCAQYWPTSAGSAMQLGEFTVTTVNVDTSSETTQRVISITNKKVDNKTATIGNSVALSPSLQCCMMY